MRSTGDEGTAVPVARRRARMRTRVPPSLAVVALAMCAGCGARAAPEAASRGAPAGTRAFAERIEGVENMARVHPGLYRGAQPDRQGLRRLREMGIRTVVNLRSRHSEREEVEALGMTCVEITMKAGLLDADPPTEDQVRRFFEVVLDPASQPVFFHCAQGKDRTGTMAALYRIEVDGWTPEEAIAEMQAFGYHDQYRDLVRFVRTYRRRGFGAGGSR